MIPEILRLKVEKIMSIREIINAIMINCVPVSFLFVFDLFSNIYDRRVHDFIFNQIKYFNC